jgi:hypothetical protein
MALPRPKHHRVNCAEKPLAVRRDKRPKIAGRNLAEIAGDRCMGVSTEDPKGHPLFTATVTVGDNIPNRVNRVELR